MYLDYVIRNTRVSIVKSAGNRGLDDEYEPSDSLVTDLGTASNVIVVGSYSYRMNSISSFSSYKMDDSDYIKPTILAPGGDIHNYSCGFGDTCHDVYTLDIPNHVSVDIGLVGTSFAAPQVAGSIALMMEYEPSLITSPQRVIAYLTAGTAVDSLSSQHMDSDSGLSKESGSGLMNLMETFEIMDFARWETYSYIGNAPMSIIVDEVYLQKDHEIRISHVYLRNQVEYDLGTYNFYDGQELSNFDLEIYNSSGQLIESCTTTFSNLEIIDFIVPKTDTYTIKVRFRTSNSMTDVHLGAIAINGNTFISSC